MKSCHYDLKKYQCRRCVPKSTYSFFYEGSQYFQTKWPRKVRTVPVQEYGTGMMSRNAVPYTELYFVPGTDSD